MLKTRKCPKCDGESILSLPTIQIPGASPPGAVLAVRAKAPWTTFGRWKFVGSMQALICEACGFTELYTRNADKLIEVEEVRRLQRRKRKAYR